MAEMYINFPDNIFLSKIKNQNVFREQQKCLPPPNKFLYPKGPNHKNGPVNSFLCLLLEFFLGLLPPWLMFLWFFLLANISRLNYRLTFQLDISPTDSTFKCRELGANQHWADVQHRLCHVASNTHPDWLALFAFFFCFCYKYVYWCVSLLMGIIRNWID